MLTTMKTTLANYTQIQSQVLSTQDSLTKFFDSLENGHKKQGNPKDFPIEIRYKQIELKLVH